MKNRKIFKFVWLFTFIVMFSSMLSACSNNNTTGSGASKTGSTTGSKEQVLNYNLGVDPKTLDPSTSNAVDSGMVIKQVFEGLLKFDINGNIIPGCAKEYKISDDGLTYTFILRDDAKWSDGKNVSSKDFIFAIKRMFDKKVAAQYVTDMYYLKNGEKYDNGECSIDDVGMKAPDDKTLVLTLENPTAYFDYMLTRTDFMPLREDVINGDTTDAWTRDPKTFIGNGAFKMKEWTAKDQIVLVKNENYHDASKVKLNEIVFKMIEDSSTALAAFSSGEVDYADKIPSTEIKKMQDEGLVKINPDLSILYYIVNLKSADKIDPKAAEVLKDKRVRQALNYSIDRESIVKNISMGGEKPALSLVAPGIKDENGQDFNNKDYFKDNNVEEAKKLLADAGYPDGKNFPTLKLTMNTSDLNKSIAEAVQDMWKKNLGINMEIESQEWKAWQQTRKDRTFVLGRHGWVGDYIDPNTFLEIFYSTFQSNYTGYNNPEYDKLLDQAKVETDKSKRWEILHKAEDTLMADLPFIPIYFYTKPYALQKDVKGMNMTLNGDINMEYMYKE